MRKIHANVMGLLTAVLSVPLMTAQVVELRHPQITYEPEQHLTSSLNHLLTLETQRSVSLESLRGEEKFELETTPFQDSAFVDSFYYEPEDLCKVTSGTGLKAFNQLTGKSTLDLPRRAVPEGLQLRAVITYDDAWNGESNSRGMYDVPLSDVEEWVRLAGYHMNCAGTLVDENSSRWWYQFSIPVGFMTVFRIIQFDTDTWQSLGQCEGSGVLNGRNKIDPTDGQAYGVDGQTWRKINYATNQAETIGTLDSGYILSLAVDKEGQFYGIDSNGSLFKIDKTNATTQLIGQTGLQLISSSGACVNEDNGTMLVFYSLEDTSGIAEINLATAQATVLKDFGRKIIAADLYIPQEKPDNVPAQPTLIATSEENSLDVLLNLTMPTALNGGEQATDESMTYKVYLGLDIVSEGSAAPGELVSSTYTAPSAGDYWFKAVVTNENGISPAAVQNIYLGYAKPSAPAVLNVEWDDDTSFLSWEPVTTSVKGSSLPPSEITYTLYGPDDETVAENIQTTTYSAPLIQQDGDYRLCKYKVTANYGDQSSDKTESEILPVGYLNAPYSTQFYKGVFPENELHIIIDANDDDATWEKGNMSYYCKPNRPDDFTFDDWFIYPGIYMEKGKAYEYKTLTEPIYPEWIEKCEIKAGLEPHPEALTIPVMTAQQVPYTSRINIPNLKFVFIPEESGRYFFGTHMISENQNKFSTAQGMSIRMYSFSEPLELSAPTAPAEFTAIAEPSGLLSVDLMIKAPDSTIGGEPISGKVRLVVSSNERIVEELTVDAGSSVSVTDNEIQTPGTYVYKVQTYSLNLDQGLSEETIVEVGPRAPSAINNISMFESADNHVVLTWDPVTTDVNGNTLPVGNVTYDVYEGLNTSSGFQVGEKLTGEPITTTTFEYDIEVSNEQRFHYLVIRAYNLGLAGTAVAKSIIVGNPYEMPVRYTDQQTCTSHLMGVSGTASLYFADDTYYTQSQDADNAMFVVLGDSIGKYCTMNLGKVRVDGNNAGMTFYVYGLETDNDANTTKVYIIDNTGEHLVKEIIHSDYCTPGVWNLVDIDLTPWQGKNILTSIRTDLVNQNMVFYDNIQLHNRPNLDLTAYLNAPSVVQNGEEFDLMVTVANQGVNNVDTYSVTLMRDGEEVFVKEFSDLEGSGKKEITFPQKLTPINGREVTYQAYVKCDTDVVPENNLSIAVKVLRRINSLPIVTGLTGQSLEDGDALSWNSIELSQPQSVPIIEDFESGESFSFEFNDWILTDADKSPFIGFSVDLPNIEIGRVTPFIIFDCGDKSLFNNTWAGRPGGTKYLASLQAEDSSDDWAISPLLSGEAQTVSFYVRSYHPSYKNTVGFYYTEEDSDEVDSFVRLASFHTNLNEWDLCEVELPEGARRFAIRAKGTQMAVIIDDVSFNAERMVDANLLGYNVYCDNVKVTETPVTNTEILCNRTMPGSHLYQLSAVYDKGESELSMPVEIFTSGVTTVLNSSNARVSGKDGVIIVSNTAGEKVSIFSTDGKILYSGIGDTRYPVQSGVYIVSAGNKTVKLVVK